MIEVRELRKEYKTGDFVQRALDGISVTFRDNEFVAVLGPSGSGKTTLLNILGGLDTADSGEIIINGTSTREYKSADWDTYRNHKIGFVFQSYNLIPHQTVRANVELAMTLTGVGAEERRTRAIEALEKVGLKGHENKKPSQLSGGQMQRVALASVIVLDPDVLIIDELTSQLDPQGTESVFAIIRKLKEQKKTIILVEHKIDLIAEFTDRVVILKDGEVLKEGDTKSVLTDISLLEHGIAIPQIAQLAIQLKEIGLPINSISVTEDGLLDILKNLLGERG